MPSEEALLPLTNKQGIFVLMTSHREDAKWTSENILLTYKGQAAAETRFRLLKDPVFLDAIYLKQPRRIEALGTVFIMALLLYGLSNGVCARNSKRRRSRFCCPANERVSRLRRKF
ncbi:hypothetical protein [Paenibacillus sp. LHD-38]|uniref:hypothetical protein n=1 Tax=Paenibacillus sp. LHD-38 TaxID=3072143 RepID=UPI00280F7928|nr:hypothetical protein [Paenibacillus sp. LHD-38]MDQ8737123.1 hypothetical protein [Paenibacillus sp. LHD-38]